MKNINQNAVEAIEAAGPYAVLKFTSGRAQVESKPMAHFMRLWPEFVHVNRSTSVNPRHITTKEADKIAVKSGKAYEISRSRREFWKKKE